MIVIEVVLTAVFLYVILGATDTRAPKGFAPTRDRPVPDPDPPDQHPGQQHLGEPGPLHRPRPLRRQPKPSSQLWVFWLAPLVGGAIAGLTYVFMFGKGERRGPLEEATEA